LGHELRILGQRRHVVLPQIQQLARQRLQLILHLGRRAGGRVLVRIGGHDSPAFPPIIGGPSGLSQCSYCIAKRGVSPAMLRCIQHRDGVRMTNGQDNGKPAVRIKKYANRRLYNTATSSYVTLDYLAQMVREGQDFTVEDAKTGEDITRSVLTQIIVEEEAKGQTMLPINFLRQLISLYGDNLQFLVPRYLEQSMEAFAKNQEQMRTYMRESFGGMFPFDRFQEMSKQNIAFFEQAMRMWSPFRGAPQGEAGTAAAAKPEAKPADLDDLKAQMQALQKQLETLAQSSRPKDD
jgi:polyhydroxyalkanoate synthesis repressor PhaR